LYEKGQVIQLKLLTVNVQNSEMGNRYRRRGKIVAVVAMEGIEGNGDARKTRTAKIMRHDMSRKRYLFAVLTNVQE
jgi:hypothetical protein